MAPSVRFKRTFYILTGCRLVSRPRGNENGSPCWFCPNFLRLSGGFPNYWKNGLNIWVISEKPASSASTAKCIPPRFVPCPGSSLPENQYRFMSCFVQRTTLLHIIGYRSLLDSSYTVTVIWRRHCLYSDWGKGESMRSLYKPYLTLPSSYVTISRSFGRLSVL